MSSVDGELRCPLCEGRIVVDLRSASYIDMHMVCTNPDCRTKWLCTGRLVDESPIGALGCPECGWGQLGIYKANEWQPMRIECCSCDCMAIWDVAGYLLAGCGYPEP